MYYSHPFRLAKTSIAKQSTSHCVVFDTQADFVGAIEHIAPMAITNSPEISVKSGLFAGAMCSIAPYEHPGRVCPYPGGIPQIKRYSRPVHWDESTGILRGATQI